MKNSCSLFSLLLVLLVFSCKEEPKYEYSQVIVNESDYDVKVRLIDYDQFAIEDSFAITPNQETTIYVAPFEELICRPIGEIEIIIPGDSLTLQKDISNRVNWIENNDGSSDELKIKKCLFIFNNSDIQ